MYQIWRCKSCPASCPLPFDEIYENPHVCPHDENIKAEFEFIEVPEDELLKMYKKIVD